MVSIVANHYTTAVLEFESWLARSSLRGVYMYTTKALASELELVSGPTAPKYLGQITPQGSIKYLIICAVISRYVIP